MDKLLPPLHLNDRAAAWLSYTTVWVMMVCAILVAVRFVQALLPGWRGEYLVVFGALVVLEAFVTRPIRNKLIVLDREWFTFYLSEFAVLLLLLKAFHLTWGGLDALLAQLAALRQDFTNNFFNTEFLFGLLFLCAIWLVSLSFSDPLEVLRASWQNLQIEEDVGTYAERSAARQALVDLALLVGTVMVVMASLMRSDRTAGWFQLPGTRQDVLIIMIYFGLALALLSLTQYSVMQMRWAINRIPVSSRMAASWALYGFLFLLLVASLSLLLPTRYSTGILTVLNILVSFGFAAIQYLIWLVLALVSLAAYYLSLLAGEPPERPPLPPAPLPTPLSPEEPGGYNIDILDWVGSLLFWGLMAALAVYLLAYFYRVRRHDFARAARLPVFSALISLLGVLRKWIGAMQRQVSRNVKLGMQRLKRLPAETLPRPSWSYTGLRRMDPRRQVIFYYLALVRRGGESGAPRDRSQTPYEYASRLEGVLDNEPSWGGEAHQSDLEDITEGFLEARYSRHAVSSEQLSQVRRSWQRLKIALRRYQATRTGR